MYNTRYPLPWNTCTQTYVVTLPDSAIALHMLPLQLTSYFMHDLQIKRRGQRRLGSKKVGSKKTGSKKAGSKKVGSKTRFIHLNTISCNV